MVKIEKFRLAVQIKASLKFIYALIILVLNLNWKSEFPVYFVDCNVSVNKTGFEETESMNKSKSW